MTVYVDDMAANFGRMKMCHMIADSTAELIEMARLIGVDPKWIQKRGTIREHFDIAQSKRAKAVLRGAEEITRKQAAKMTRLRRADGTLPRPEELPS